MQNIVDKLCGDSAVHEFVESVCFMIDLHIKDNYRLRVFSICTKY